MKAYINDKSQLVVEDEFGTTIVRKTKKGADGYKFVTRIVYIGVNPRTWEHEPMHAYVANKTEKASGKAYMRWEPLKHWTSHVRNNDVYEYAMRRHPAYGRTEMARAKQKITVCKIEGV